MRNPFCHQVSLIILFFLSTQINAESIVNHHAKSISESKVDSVEHLYLGEGDNKIIYVPFKPKIISVGKKEIADYAINDTGSLVVYGKTRGATNIVAVDETGEKHFSTAIVVGPSKSTLVAYINSVEPSGDIQFNHLSDGKFIVSGHASSYSNKKRICDFLSSALEPRSNRNASQSSSDSGSDIVKSSVNVELDSYHSPNITCDIGVQQKRELINVSIKMLEVSDSLVRKLGVNWADSFNTTNVFRLGHGFSNVNAFVQALLVSDKTKLLAEPNISVLAGQKAQFKAGGELPIVSVDKEGNQTVTFKPYGVLLQMGADVESSGEIKVGINSEISRLDPNNSYELQNGARFSALTTQSAATTLLVNNGETFILGGLSSYEVSSRDSGVPFLSKVPILSAAVNHVDERKENKQVIIVATVKTLNSTDERYVKYKTIPTNSLVSKFLGFSGYDLNKMDNVGIDELNAGMEMY